MSTQYRSKNERRRTAVRETKGSNGRPLLNGIDYLEVGPDQKTLVVYLIHNLAELSQENTISTENILITGGTHLTVQVESVSSFANVLIVRVNQVGDFSAYTLSLVKSPLASQLAGFDPQLTQVDFYFWVGEQSEFDCQALESPVAPKPPGPIIDYLAKDYASFRRLILDRLAVTMPQWQERNPADVGIMLVELLAYAGDYLSYYQDAVATEAYLETARKRVSVRRHVRLLDYLMHDGCNARAWISIQLQVSALDGIKLLGPSLENNRPGVQFLTQTYLRRGLLPKEKFDDALNAGAQVFESLHDVTLYSICNSIVFYTWGDEQCYLPKGATQATLYNGDGLLQKRLQRGSLLLFEEVLGSESGDVRDADRSHRHVVRLTQVMGRTDPLNGQLIVEVTWSATDALPFDLQISNVDAHMKPISNISVARGNVLLVDAGRTLAPVDLRQASGWERLRPSLKEGPLTQQGYVYVQGRQNPWVVFDSDAAASAAMQWQLKDTRSAIVLWENRLPGQLEEPGSQWQPQRDLLISDRFDRDFVVETEDDGTAYLRFGDDKLGRRPQMETPLFAVYRIGNGRSGNVGAEAIANIIIQPENLEGAAYLRLKNFLPTASDQDWSKIFDVRNPLPAQGGTEPEAIEQVRLYAPQAFLEQRRAVTEADYETIAQRYPGVKKALATRRWTGSWQTIFITVEREDVHRPVDEEFQQGLLAFLEEFRLAGHDIEIDGPRFVPLEIAMKVKVESDYFRSAVKQALLDAFSNRVLVNGQLGFFHPDNFTFGQPVYLSQVIATAMKVSGVQTVRVTRFQRWGEAPKREFETGQISFDRLEIAHLDNDPSNPGQGRIEFNLEGGL